MEVNDTKFLDTPPVAIIGIGCFFPRSSGLKAFWHLLYHGKDAISEVPPSHWSVNDYYDEDPRKPDHVYCRRGGFLSPVPFDPTAFGIPPSNLEATDTSQILGLIAAKRALEEAGYGEGTDFKRDQTAVILGVTGTQELVIPLSSRLSWPKWKQALDAAGVEPDKARAVMSRLSGEYVNWQENSFPGLLGNVVAGRICNRLDLGGTNCVVDAACASSMSAINLALMELYTGRSRMVVTGGVDTLNDIFMHMCFARTQILSPTGDVRPFSKNADGTVLGEGIGIVIMKRLADAETDGDRILAMVKGIGSSSDGKSQSIYAPRAEGQVKALRKAYDAARVATEGVDMIEAHGTGTRVGDKIEVQALKQIFGVEDATPHCALGSVKSMIGHTKAAAGAAGFIKTVLALHNKVLLPTLKAEEPDPDLEFDKGPFYLNPKARPWFRKNDTPRRAGVSAFGFGGSNFHIVLEEYDSQRPVVAWDGSIEIIALSGSSSETLKTAFRTLEKTILDSPPEAIPHIARETRSAFKAEDSFRLLLVLTREEDTQGPRWNAETVFKEAAQAFDNDDTTWQSTSSFYGSGERPGRLVFLFPGQGSQYLHMGRDLVTWFPEAMQALESAAHVFQGHKPLTDLVFPIPSGKHTDQAAEEALRNTAVAQPAIGGVSVAMEKILRRFGLEPEATCGHSYGELTALYSAGWIDEDTLHALSTLRGRLMAEAGGDPDEPNGAMLAVKAPLEALERLLEEEDLDVVLANRNSPNQGILSGDVNGIAAAEAACKTHKFRTVRLPVSAAFHSRLVEQARAPFASALESIDVHPSSIPVYSNTTGAPYPRDLDGMRSLLGEHLRNPVNFIDEIDHLHTDEGRIFVEVGPKTVLTGLVRAILKGRDFHALAMDASSGKKFGIHDLANLLCHLAALGCPVRWDEWESHTDAPPRYKMRIPVSGANFRPKLPQANKRIATDKAFVSRKTMNDPLDPKHTLVPKEPERLLSAPSMATPARGIESHANRQPSAAANLGHVEKTSVSNTLNKSNHPVLQALQVVQQGLQSLQTLQTQTVEAHQKFLDTQQQASRTLQEMMASSRRFAETLLNGEDRPEIDATFPATSPAAAETTASPAAALQGSQPDRPAVEPPSGHSDRGIADDSVAHRQGNPENTASHAHVAQTLLAVISELTGYPVDMLNMDMHIEADLGIDSIKRVEILSRMETELPTLPPITPDIIAEFQTLGQISAYLAGPPTQADSHDSQNKTGVAQGYRTDDNVVGTDVAAALMEVVSELTGYPAEMLNLEMDVEADLGIDSIKRVEILSALEDRIPDFPGVAPDEMAALKTLGQIASHLQSPGGTSAPVRQAVDRSTASAPSETAPKMVRQALMEVVSHLTGYPQEMLSDEMDIEADLGIDSIKRVEILSAMEDRLPQLPDVAPDDMAGLKTLGQIAEALAGKPSPDHPAPQVTKRPAGNVPAVPQTSENGATAELMRRELTFIEAPRQSAPLRPLPQNRKVFITTDKAGLSHALADQLSSHGLSTVQISVDILKHREQLPDAAGLILLGDIEEIHEGAPDPGKPFLGHAFDLMRHLGSSLQTSADEDSAFLATISRMDGAFGLKNHLYGRSPYQGGLAGMAKTAAIEWPGVTCRALDVDARWQDNPAIAREIVMELLHPSPDAPVEVGLGADRRLVPDLKTAAIGGDRDLHLDLDAGDVVVISGGARGVTAFAAETLARRKALTLILLGRSPKPFAEPEWLQGLEEESEIKRAIIANDFPSVRPTPQAIEKTYQRYCKNREIQDHLTRIESHGATVRYFTLDIRNTDRVEAVLNDVRLVHGPIKALIHGAGVLRDRLITDKTPEEFHEVFSTKVDGMENLLTATREDPLRYIILFSSVAARFGNMGQVDYAVANEVLNKLAVAESARRKDCLVRSINWGPWDGGMVNASLKKAFLEKGIALIPLAQGAEALVAEMSAKNTQAVEVVIGSDLPVLKTPHTAGGTPNRPPAEGDDNSRGLSTIFISELNLDHYPILDHHRLDEKPVVPFALMAEWFGHGALHNHPGLQLAGLDNMRLLKGIVLEDRQRPIRVLAAPAVSSDDGIRVDLELRDGVADGAEVIHSRATAVLSERLPSPPDFQIPETLREASYDRDVPQIYNDILFHGSALQGIRRVFSCNAQGMRAELKTAPPPGSWIQKPPRNRWIADPLVLDCAFQMASLWCYEQTGRVSLPSYSSVYRQYCRRFPALPIHAVLVAKTVSRYKLVGDFIFLDPEGQVLADITGFEAVMEDRLIRAFKPKRYAAAR